MTGDLGLARIRSDAQWAAAYSLITAANSGSRHAYFGGNDIVSEVSNNFKVFLLIIMAGPLCWVFELSPLLNSLCVCLFVLRFVMHAT